MEVFQKNYFSPIGEIIMEGDGEFLTSLQFKTLNNKSDEFQVNKKSLQIFVETEKWLDIYFSGLKPNFTPKYKVQNASTFRQQVLELVSQIPFGSTVTYKQIAEKIKLVRGVERMSAQAIGGAVGWNPICLIIPCHRVVGSKSLVGYGGGLDKKIELLKLEKVQNLPFLLN